MEPLSTIVQINNRYDEIKSKGKEALNSLSNFINHLNASPRSGSMFSNIKHNSTFSFSFIDIDFNISINHNTVSGFIFWEIVRKYDEKEEKTVVFQHRFDKLGNIYIDGENVMDVITSEYGNVFLSTLAYILNDYYIGKNNYAPVIC